MSWTYSLLQFIAQTHPRPYWWSRGSGAVRPWSEGRGAGAQLWRAVLAKPQPPGRFNYWWQEVMLSRERGIAFQSLNCWQQLSPSRKGERAFIPKAKTAAGSCSPSACGAPMAAGSGGLHEDKYFRNNFRQHRPWNPNGIFLSGCSRQVQPSLVENTLKQRLADLRRTSFVPWSHVLVSLTTEL